MRIERATQGEVISTRRSAGVTDPAQVGAVVLETDGSLNAIDGDAPGRGAGAVPGVAG